MKSEVLNVSWDEIQEGVEYLAEQIKPLSVGLGSYATFTSDHATLVGVTRGGMIVASWLSHVLESKGINTRVCAFGMCSYSDREQLGNPAESVFQVPDKRMLLDPVFVVDDVITTGDTLKYATRFLRDMGVRGVLTCVLYSNGKGANLVYKSVDRWVVFPWESS